MSIYFRNPVNLPSNVVKELDAYTEEDEELVDAIRETFQLAIDFRWLVLTSARVILVVEKLLSIEFRDVRFDGIDMQLKEGFFYDSLRIKSMTDDYSAQFYALTRGRTKKFLQNLEDERDRFQKEKKKNEKLVEQEAMEELGSKGPLDERRQSTEIIADMDHNKNELDKRMWGKRGDTEHTVLIPEHYTGEDYGESETMSPEEQAVKDYEASLNPIDLIEGLLRLRNEGAITEEEYQQKKNNILNKI